MEFDFFTGNKSEEITCCQKVLPVSKFRNNLLPNAFAHNKNSIQKNNIIKLDANATWLRKIYQDIEQMEYHISFDSSANFYQCPNRNNNIRAYFQPGIFTMRNRVDSIDHNWMVKLVNEGIYADSQIIELPQTNADVSYKGNEVFIKHSSFEEQYINSLEGIRQNFIINNAPARTKELRVKMKVEGLLVKQANQKELHFYQIKEGCVENIITYNDLKVWDADNKDVAAHFETVGNEIAIVVNAQNARYPITIDPISTPAATVLQGNQANAHFGNSVASAGDINHDGYADIIVGAPQYDNGQTDEGAVFIYHGSPTGINTNAAVILESNTAGANFGYKVSSAGDVNNDQFSDILISEYPVSSNRGKVYIYHGSAAGINPMPVTILNSGRIGDQYGWAIASAGDVNNDSYSDVVVGAYTHSNGEPNEGAFYVYHGSASGVDTIPEIFLESNHAIGYWGTGVSSAGDVNNDTYSDIIIGADLYTNGQTYEGAAFVFYGSASGINTTTYTMLEANQANAKFGNSVASAGDVNGDHYSDVIVGAWQFDNGQTDEGRAFIYYGSASGINTTPAAIIESNQAGANMGISVASASDINGDGYSDIIIGAYAYNNGQNNEGAAFIYQGKASGINPANPIRLESNQADAEFGRSVASAGDVNGDGYSDIIIGARMYDNGQTDEGVAFVYHGAPEVIARFTVNDTVICAGETLIFTNTSTAFTGSPDSVRWSINGGVPSTSTSVTTVTSVFNTSGAYTISLIAYKGGVASKPFTKSIVVNALPTVSPITGTTTLCAGSTTQLSSTTGGGTWSSSNATVATINSITGLVSGVSAGTSIISYSMTQSGCTRTLNATVTVNALPTVNPITGTTTLCAGSTTQLSSATSGGTWSSSNTTVATINSSTGLVSGVSAGTSIISYSVTQSGCTQTANTIVTATNCGCSNPPVVSLSSTSGSTCGTTAVTIGNNTFGGSATAISISENGAGSLNIINATSSPFNFTYTPVPADVGNTVTITVTTNNPSGSPCIASTVTYLLTVNALPIVNPITGTTNICIGTATQLNSTTTGGTWSSSNVAIATVDNMGLVNGISEGGSTITYSKTVSGCSNGVTATVNVNSLPPPPSITGSGDTLFSNVIIVGASYEWYKEGILQSATTTPFFKFTSSGMYTLKVNNNGCWSNMSVNFNAILTGIQMNKLNIRYGVLPNPNHGTFDIALNSTLNKVYDMKIYNNLGQIIFLDQIDVKTGFNSKTINIPQIEKGIYFLSLIDDNEISTQSILIE